jgi:hypothetical protein
MTREELKKHLREEMDKYAENLSYEKARGLRKPIVEQYGNADSDAFYQVDVRVLQSCKSGDEDWIEVSVSVDDGTPHGGRIARLLRAVTPETGAIVFHRDGRVEKMMRRPASSRA